jgi:hypothetical protein
LQNDSHILHNKQEELERKLNLKSEFTINNNINLNRQNSNQKSNNLIPMSIADFFDYMINHGYSEYTIVSGLQKHRIDPIYAKYWVDYCNKPVQPCIIM